MTQSNTSEYPNQGPHLIAALLCEKLLVEADGVTSAIRIVDRINRTAVGVSPPAEMDPFDYELFLYVNLKSGATRGPMTLEVRLEKVLLALTSGQKDIS